MKLLEENVNINLHDLGLGNGFLNITLKTQFQEQKNEQINWTSSKLKTFVHQRTLSREQKDNSWIECYKIFGQYIFDEINIWNM